MKISLQADHVLFERNPMIYGHFLEHFHRQIYGGVYMPGHPLSDADGFREDVLDALRGIRTPVIRWPGGCYVSAYHWKNGVGKTRQPAFDKAWRVEESNAFGTDEFLLLCKKLGCEPYLCTNAGSGTPEEMSDWVEYCNLPREGVYARMRIANGHEQPYGVRYWSIGNENYYDGEIGSKTPQEWGRFVRESSKMMLRVDPGLELSAAAIANIDWNVHLLSQAGHRLKWISIHGYWDGLWQVNEPSSYTQCMAQTAGLDSDLRKIRGLLMAFGLEKQVKIAYDEWNLRGWHHPNVDTAPLGDAAFIQARDLSDDNATYTMADAVFSACFLNMLLRNGDVVGMANFAPVVNTRGAIFTHDKGVVLRPTYHVFRLYTALMGDQVIDCFTADSESETMTAKSGEARSVDLVDVVATRRSVDGALAVSLINKHPSRTLSVDLACAAPSAALVTLSGSGPDDYNDVGRDSVRPYRNDQAVRSRNDGLLTIALPPHSVNILTIPAREAL